MQWIVKKKIKGQIFSKTEGHCAYCGQILNPFNEWTIDHKTPQKQGGNDELENLFPCCKSCNSAKKDRTIEEFREYIEGYYEMRIALFQSRLLAVPQVIRNIINQIDDMAFIDLENKVLNQIWELRRNLPKIEIKFFFEQKE